MPELTINNPITGEPVDRVLNNTPDDVFQAVERARAAQPGWNARGARGRARLLRLWADALWRSRDTLVQTIRAETGKTDTNALLEIIVLDAMLDYYAHHAPRLLRPQRRRTLFPVVQTGHVYYEPHGVAGFITPWNYPYFNALGDAIPALVAGNAVVIKPSELTPLTSLHAARIAYMVGIPRDVLQIVTGDGQTGAALVDGVDCISVTGSTATGRKVALRAAERLIPYTLELGGKDPMIVLEDADVDEAARAILQGGLENAGQMCVSIERVYAHERIYDALVARVQTFAAQIQVGTGDGLDVHMGSMQNERELVRSEAHIADALAKGATLVCGGKRRPDIGPLFLEPTVLAGVDHSMDVMRDETFGPLIPIMRVSSAAEAIRLANDSRYGLSSCIFSNDLKRAERLAQQLCAGDTSINRPQFVVATPSLPMGGRGESGVGRRGGPEGLLRFVTTHSVLVDRRWVRNDALTLLDPVLYQLYKLLRVARRVVPFLRPTT